MNSAISTSSHSFSLHSSLETGINLPFDNTSGAVSTESNLFNILSSFQVSDQSPIYVV